jgi:ABC-type antimicrobial peptide transport system permease subunit
MLKNYFTIALRNLARHTFFSAINILCLALGITFALIIGIDLLNQYAINASIKNVGNQYIIKSNWKVKEMGLDATTFGPLAKVLKEEYPALVANYYRYNPVTNVISAGDKSFKEDIAIGDTSFITMYGWPVLYGNRQQAFADNSSAVITEKMALKLYGRSNAVGETINMLTLQNGARQVYKVSAVLKDIPYNSVHSLFGDGYDVFVPTIGNNYFGGGDPAEGWNGAFEAAMIELKPRVSPKDLTIPFKQLLAKYTPATVQKNLTVDLAPVKDYYLEDNNGAALRMIRILSLAAAFILLMAIINFVNINIGTSSYRLKEIGLRKVFGGERTQLIFQFITEAMLLTVIAAIISLVLYQLVRPTFSSVLNTKLPSIFQFRSSILLYIIALVLITGFLAGIYPAFVLSSLRITNAVKGKIDAVTGGQVLRKSMLLVQFTLGTFVFICALIVSKQVSYIFSKDIGYKKEQVLVITAFPKQWDTAGTNKMLGMRTALMQIPSVKNASLSFETPDRKPPNSVDMQSADSDGRTVLITSCGADENYAATFGFTLLSGTCFKLQGGYIPNQIVLNESAVKALGLTVQSAVNKVIKIPSSGTLLTVAGVIKDYHYSSLQSGIEPIAFFNVRDWLSYRYLSLKLNTTDMAATIATIKNKWKELSPNSPFEYTFMDDKFRALYRSEIQLKTAAGIATILNLFIIFLGIFGVVSFTLTKRTKEIAVRKVLGAGIWNIITLFARDYAWLLLLANIIAWPVTYILMNKWLQGYAYRINQALSPYIIVGSFVFIVALVMIAVQCTRAGLANPVKSLKSE